MATQQVIDQLETLEHKQYNESLALLTSMLDGNSLTLDEAVELDRLHKVQLAANYHLIRAMK